MSATTEEITPMASPKSSVDLQKQQPNDARVDKTSEKCNLSFMFNFDLKTVISDDSSDSEKTDLQIDVAEIDEYQSPKKRSRIEIDETSALNEMEEEIERQLDAKAAKTNLTATNVKNILRHVITNEHVMAMVQNRLHNTEDGTVFEPKLTRAKAKELAMQQPNMPWPMTPMKKTSSSEVQELIEKDLSEDSSDEEYSPEEEPQSEDEIEIENMTGSDVELQQSPIVDSLEKSPTPDNQEITEIHHDHDGVFKIPEIPHVPTEDESIGQRTRSKLSLSETPLEQIEQAFIPPDITIDMYDDWDHDKDPDWNNFLKEFTQPLCHLTANEDDPEADPEYNILEDKETDLLDKEELRMDKAVKVTKKELNDLVAELFEFEDMFTMDKVESPKKRNTPETTMTITQNITRNNCMVDLIPALAEPELPKLVSSGQLNLLATQLRQHVQLLTQHFGMTYMHPELHVNSIKCKDNLRSFSFLKDGADSAFNVENLSHALKFIDDWEEKFHDTDFAAQYKSFIEEEIRMDILQSKKGHKYIPKFHPELVTLFIESRALMYPQLLPHTPFRTSLLNSTRARYLNSEECLIALGLEQFSPFVEARKSKFLNKKMRLMDTVQLISQYMLPCRPPNAMFKHILHSKASKMENPIKHYFRTGYAPRTIHCIMLECVLVAPIDQPRECLPSIWQEYVARVEYLKNRERRQRKVKLLKKVTKGQEIELTKPTDFMSIDPSYVNPIVNALPNITKSSSESKNEAEKSSCPVETNDESSDMTVVDETVNTRVPQMRKRKPRLAKIRSAQNIKMMAKVSVSQRMAICRKRKSRAKSESSKDESEESRGPTKGDNEDEIAELMLASTTIKKETASRKKAKQARELENIKRLLDAESESAQDERASKFAESYVQKLHRTLESTSPETLKSVSKIFVEYNEQLEAINRKECLNASSIDINNDATITTNERREKERMEKDLLAINLYKDVCNELRDHPDLRTDFLLFLNPHQAAMIDESTQHTMLRKMSEFMNVAQIYFAKQPSRLTKVMRAITQLASDRYVTMADVNAAMEPILKGHPLVMDMFLQVFPMGKPPESLFSMNLFENLTCPMGPHDKHKIYSQDSAELYENIELPLPTFQDDPYGGDNCHCDCHDPLDPNCKMVTVHCLSCGMRFLNGRIYLQTSEGLRPAKITYPGNEEEKLENIARISLKTSDRFVPGPTTSRRRKSSKNETTNEEASAKQCAAKSSPTKENADDADRTKSRRSAKSPPKICDQKKNEYSPIPSTSNSGLTYESTSPLKSMRETRAVRREAKLESQFTETTDNCRINDDNYPGTSESNVDSDSEDTIDIKEEIIENMDWDCTTKPWTRNEDMILLQNMKDDYSDTMFGSVSSMLGNRSTEEVQERSKILLSLLERMA